MVPRDWASRLLHRVIVFMRATLTIDDDVLRSVKGYAESRSLTMEDAVRSDAVK